MLWIIPGEDDVDCFLTTMEAAAADLVGDGSDRFGEFTTAAAGFTGFIIVVIIIGNLLGCRCGWCVVAARGPSLVSLDGNSLEFINLGRKMLFDNARNNT